MPDKIKQKEEGDEHLLRSISAKLAPKSTMKLVPHTFTSVNNFLLYQIQHDYILNQQEAQPKWKTLSLFPNDIEVKVAAINTNRKMRPTKQSKH